MNSSDRPWINPLGVLAAGAAGGLTVFAALWGLSYLLPSLGAAAGYLAAGAIHGAVSGAMVGLLSNVALWGGTLIIGGGGIYVGIRVVKQAAKKPFSAAVVSPAPCQTFLLDMEKE